jgi:hypothetical protein
MSAIITGPNVSPGDAPIPQRIADPRKELYVVALARQMHEAVVMSVVTIATGRRPKPRERGIQMKFVKPRTRTETPMKFITSGRVESKDSM